MSDAIPRRIPEGNEFEITIDKIVYGGSGLGRFQGKVVFVPFTAVGDRVRVRVVREKKTYLEARVTEVIDSGPDRQEPFCSHFGTCGGCQWQHLSYSSQLQSKQQILEELFHHRYPETAGQKIPMTASPAVTGYRNRARLQIRGTGADAKVGFYQFHSHQVEDLESCPLLRTSLNVALSEIRSMLRGGVWTNPSKELDIACSERTGTWSMTPRGEDRVSGPIERDPTLSLSVKEFDIRVAPSCFFQANDFLLEPLVEAVQELAEAVTLRRNAVELFAGIGLFTLPLAQMFQEVIAVESTSDGAAYCRSNARAAGHGNIRVVAADVASWLDGVEENQQPPADLVLLDPPRAGAGPKITERLARWGPKTIIYVSCDPQTLVRDLSVLHQHGYGIDSVQGLDLFPQTYHFETLVRLRRTEPDEIPL